MTVIQLYIVILNNTFQLTFIFAMRYPYLTNNLILFSFCFLMFCKFYRRCLDTGGECLLSASILLRESWRNAIQNYLP